MKKIVSLLLCLLLACALPAAALADGEPAAFSISDISLNATAEGENISMDFEDLELVFSLVEEEGNLLVLNIFDGDKLLLSGSGKLDGNRVYFTVDGLSHTYYAEMSEEGGASAPAIGSNPLSDEEMQALVEQLMSQLEISQDGTTTTFRLPYTAVNQLLDQLLPVFEQIPTLDSDTFAELEGAIAEMKETDSGVEINGSFDISDTAISGVVNFLPVANGTAADAPAAYVNFEANIGSEIIIKGDMNIQNDDGSYTKAFAFTLTMGDTFDFEMIVEDATIHVSFDPSSSRLLIEFHQDEIEFTFGATVSISERELSAGPIGDLSAALDVQNLSDEQMNELQSELTTVSAKLIGSLYSILASSGVLG
jgi:hypothetical protein